MNKVQVHMRLTLRALLLIVPLRAIVGGLTGRKIVLILSAVAGALLAVHGVGAELSADIAAGSVRHERGGTVRQYQIDVRLVCRLPDGSTRVECEPVLVISENRPARFVVGGQSNAPGRLNVARYGEEFDVVLARKEGRLLLHLKGSISDPSHVDSPGAGQAAATIEVVEQVTLGKKIIVDAPHGQQMRWEVLVRELPPGSAGPLPWPEDCQSRSEKSTEPPKGGSGRQTQRLPSADRVR